MLTKLKLSIAFCGLLTTALFAQNKLTTVNGSTISKQQLSSQLKNIFNEAQIEGAAVVLINNATPVFSENFGVKYKGRPEKINASTLFEVASLSKPVFAFFVMQQLEKGIIQLDQPLYTYLPNNDAAFDDRYKKITPRMVLTHTAGFHNWRKYTNDSLKLLFQPGTKYRYSGEAYHYLRDVLAHQYQQNSYGLDSLFIKEIVKPLQLGTMAFTWQPEMQSLKAFGHRKGKPTNNRYQKRIDRFGAAGGIHCSAETYAKFLITVMKKQLLQKATWELMMEQQTNLPHNPKSNTHRSLAFPIKQTKDGLRYYHSGSNGDFESWAHFYPDKNYGIVILTNSDRLFKSGALNKIMKLLGEDPY